jgi:hypothetical protein
MKRPASRKESADGDELKRSSFWTGVIGAECECNEEGPDGFLDLTLKFDTQAIIDAIGPVSDRETLELELTGMLIEELGGISIEGTDCILVLSKGRH